MTGTSHNDFLDNVRRALGRSGPTAVPEYAPLKIRRNDQRQKVVTIEARAQARRAELLDRLSSEASDRGWQVYRAPSSEEAVAYMVALASRKRAGLIVRSSHQVFQNVPLDDALRNHGGRVTVVATDRRTPREELRQEMGRADMGITGVDYAIAETGTCVLVPRKGVSRAVSLLPPIHVALVEPHQVYETLDDLFALRRLAFLLGRGDMGSYLSFISGPSRTADIEQTIVVGVHGPVEAHMVILDSAEG